MDLFNLNIYEKETLIIIKGWFSVSDLLQIIRPPAVSSQDCSNGKPKVRLESTSPFTKSLS